MKEKHLRKNTACKVLVTFVYALSTVFTAVGAVGTLYLANYDCYSQPLKSFKENNFQRELLSDIDELNMQFENLGGNGYFDENTPEQRKKALYRDFIKRYEKNETNFFFAIYDADDNLLMHSYSDDYQLSRTQLFYDTIRNEEEKIMSENEYAYFTEHFYENYADADYTADQIVVPRGDPAPTIANEENHPDMAVSVPETEPISEPTEVSETEVLPELTEVAGTEPLPELTEVPINDTSATLGLVAHAEDIYSYQIEEQTNIAEALGLDYNIDGDTVWVHYYDADENFNMMAIADYFQLIINQIPNFDIITQNGWHYVIDKNAEPPSLMEVADYIRNYPEEFDILNISNETTVEIRNPEYCDIYYDVHIYTTETPVSHYITGYVSAVLTAQDAYFNADRYLSLMYQYRYAVPIVGACSAVVMLLSLIFLVSSAGYHTGEDTAKAGIFEKIPYDVFTAVLGITAAALLIFASEYVRDNITGMVLGLAICLIWSLILLWWLMSTAVRIRTKTILENNLIFKLLKITWNFLKKIKSKMGSLFGILPLVWKAGLIAGGFVMLDVISTVLINESEGFGIFLKFILWTVTILGTIVLVYQLRLLEKGAQNLADGHLDEKIPENRLFSAFRKHAQNLNSLGDGMNKAVSDRLRSEMFRTELIANVSHDIRTPLTSIINYTDLLSKLNLTDETAQEYINVLSRQSARLRKLTEDVLEASKATTGSMKVEKEDMDLKVLLQQLEGEYAERFEAKHLTFISSIPDESLPVCADGRLLWRAFDNLFTNICKYAMEHTRVYLNAGLSDMQIHMTLRNISAVQLNIDADTLMERFVRGDRSRNTEGSGLGLSIAQSLINLQGGDMQLFIDGDLFKVAITLPAAKTIS